MPEIVSAPDGPRAAAVDALRGLIRNELSAVETYTRVIQAAEQTPVIEQLQRIRDDHLKAARGLGDHLAYLNGPAADHAEPWPPVARLTESRGGVPVAPLLAALCRCEEQALGTLEATLHGDDLYPDCRRTVSADLLPAGRQHIDDLNRLLAGRES